jgi:predicted ester cyclase
MQPEEAKTIVRRFYERCMNADDAAAVAEIIAPDFVDRSYAMSGIDAVLAFMQRSRADFPDLHFTIEDMIAEGDRVAVRWTGHGTHKNGRHATWTGMGFYRIVDSKIAEHWANVDQLGLQRQLGLLSG